MATNVPHPIVEAFLAGMASPDLGPGPRPGIRDADSLLPPLHKTLTSMGLPEERASLVKSLVLLWHDHLEASHEISQGIPSADGSYVHGIMHRREPDFSNAAYWFRKVGRHPAFIELAAQVSHVLSRPEGENWSSRLLPGGQWDPFAFIDACEEATRGPSIKDQIELLQELQALEFHVLLEWFCS